MAVSIGVDLYVARTDEFHSFDPGGDLVMSLPLLILATLTLVGAVSIPASLIGLVAIGAFTGFFYRDVLTSDSSTAAIGLAFTPILGVLLVLLLWGGDALARAELRHLRRTAPPPDGIS